MPMKTGKINLQKQAERIARMKLERQAHHKAVSQELIAAYKNHPDRTYAMEFYGSMLQERGIDPTSL